MLPHSMPVPVRLAWPQMAYAPGLSMPVPLHMLAAQFPQAYSAAAGENVTVTPSLLVKWQLSSMVAVVCLPATGWAACPAGLLSGVSSGATVPCLLAGMCLATHVSSASCRAGLAGMCTRWRCPGASCLGRPYERTWGFANPGTPFSAGSGPDMAALWASLPLPQSLSGNVMPAMHMLPPQAAAATNSYARASPFACPVLVKAQQLPSGQRQ